MQIEQARAIRYRALHPGPDGRAGDIWEIVEAYQVLEAAGEYVRVVHTPEPVRWTKEETAEHFRRHGVEVPAEYR